MELEGLFVVAPIWLAIHISQFFTVVCTQSVAASQTLYGNWRMPFGLSTTLLSLLWDRRWYLLVRAFFIQSALRLKSSVVTGVRVLAILPCFLACFWEGATCSCLPFSLSLLLRLKPSMITWRGLVFLPHFLACSGVGGAACWWVTISLSLMLHFEPPVVTGATTLTFVRRWKSI